MEPRWLMSTYTVNTTSDAANPGAGLLTLRQAVTDVNNNAGSNTITFSPTVFAAGTLHTITLLNGQLTLTDPSGATTITGPGSGVLDVTEADQSRMFYVSTGVTASITGLQLSGGYLFQGALPAPEGGAIYNAGTLSISNCVISNNQVEAYGSEFIAGGAIFNSGSLTVDDSMLENNSAIDVTTDGGGGGAIYSSGILAISGSTISGNGTYTTGPGAPNSVAPVALGGGIYSTGITDIQSSNISSNSAYVPFDGTNEGTPGNASGGGIYTTGPLTLTSDEVTDNSATGMSRGGEDERDFSGNASGGGIWAANTVSIAATTITGNQAIGGDAGYYGTQGEAQGGGVFATAAMTITGSTVSGNSAIEGRGNEYSISDGGGIFSESTLTVTTSTISGNTAGETNSGTLNYSNYGPNGPSASGGGIFDDGQLTLTSSTVAGNAVAASNGREGIVGDDGALTGIGNGGNASGGGIYIAGSLAVYDSTISGNSTTPGLGGESNAVANGQAIGSGVDIQNVAALFDNSIISGNLAQATDVAGTINPSSGNNLIGTGSNLINAVNGNQVGVTNPMLGALANYGGPTETMLPLPGSSAIDRGSNALIPSGVASDQRNDARISNGTVDIGAVEVQTSTAAPLTGTVIGTVGSYANDGDTITNVFDRNLDTYFDGPSSSTDWAGLNLGSAYVITQISYAPRSGWESRMVGGEFQGSNNPNFSSDVTTLYTVTTAPTAGVLTSVSITNTTAFEYVRYLGPSGGYCNISEAQFFGTAATGPAGLTGTVIGTAGSYANDGETITNVFDGNLNTYFDGPSSSNDWAGLDLGSTFVITQISYAPRSGWASRMVGGTFQGSNVANFSSGVTNLYTITATPTVGVLTTVSITNTTAFRYVRYIGPAGGYCNISEAQFFGSATTIITPPPLTGAVIGTAGSYANDGDTIANVFDGNLSTYFDGPSSSNDWAGLDLGSTFVITQISYAPRSGWASRMVGGTFQGSNVANFSSGVTNLCTITTTPTAGVLTTVSIANATAFRYVRYIGPANGYCNISEAEFFGTASATTVVKLSGAAIGTSGSYGNQGKTIANAFDGNFSTYFDAPSASGDWVGLDLGTAEVVTQVKYAPRAGLENRMVGGMFQASNTADFSSGVVTLFTITSTPTAGVLTTQSLSNTAAYRYYRYIGPTDGYCNIAELEFDG